MISASEVNAAGTRLQARISGAASFEEMLGRLGLEAEAVNDLVDVVADRHIPLLVAHPGADVGLGFFQGFGAGFLYGFQVGEEASS